jgi:hypothetical protein
MVGVCVAYKCAIDALQWPAVHTSAGFLSFALSPSGLTDPQGNQFPFCRLWNRDGTSASLVRVWALAVGEGRSGEVSYRSMQQEPAWWPANLGTPSAVGAQNDLRYAVFPRRLAIKDGAHVEVYDTGNHQIFGVAQARRAPTRH